MLYGTKSENFSKKTNIVTSNVHNVKSLLIAVLPAHDQVVKEYFSLGFYASMIRLSRVMYAETFDEILSKRL